MEVVAGLLGLFRFRRMYVADLDAIEGIGDHAATLSALAATWPEVEFWVDAGVAGADAARAWLSRGVGCLVLGGESQADVAAVEVLRDEPRAILSLDFRGETFLGPPGLLEQPEIWPARVIAMTLGRVGSRTGPDFSRLAKNSRACSRPPNLCSGRRSRHLRSEDFGDGGCRRRAGGDRLAFRQRDSARLDGTAINRRAGWVTEGEPEYLKRRPSSARRKRRPCLPVSGRPRLC